MCPQNARNAISGTQVLKPSLAKLEPIRYSAHTFGDRGYPHGGGQGENGPFGNLSHPD